MDFVFLRQVTAKETAVFEDAIKRTHASCSTIKCVFSLLTKPLYWQWRFSRSQMKTAQTLDNLSEQYSPFLWNQQGQINKQKNGPVTISFHPLRCNTIHSFQQKTETPAKWKALELCILRFWLCFALRNLFLLEKEDLSYWHSTGYIYLFFLFLGKRHTESSLFSEAKTVNIEGDKGALISWVRLGSRHSFV